MFWCSKLTVSIWKSTCTSKINYQIQFQEHQNEKTSKHTPIKFTQIITKQRVLWYSKLIQENKVAIVKNLRSYNLPVAYYHSNNKRKKENPLPLTSNEAIPPQGNRRRSRDHSQERIDPMASCGSNVFQGYFDDAKESRVKKSFKQRFKNQVSSFKIQDSRIKFQESRIKNNQDQD